MTHANEAWRERMHGLCSNRMTLLSVLSGSRRDEVCA
jgi:hypothetical protein